MALRIIHGVAKTTTGSSQLTDGDEIVFTTINEQLDPALKSSCDGSVEFDVRFRHSNSNKANEGLVQGLVKKLLMRYTLQKMLKYRVITVNIFANTMNLSLICNSIVVACLDGGIPLSLMFYCTGNQKLFVIEKGVVVLAHSLGPVTESDLEKALKEEKYIEESIRYAIKDMFLFSK